MIYDFKKYDEVKKFFTDSCHLHNPCEVILFHDQRDTVNKMLAEVAQETGRKLIDKDLSTLLPNELGSMTLDRTLPGWLSPVLKDKDGKGYIIYLREYHVAPLKVQTDVLNVLIKKNFEGVEFPKNTLIVVGARKEDEAAEGLTHTHVVKFYK
jgi:hypothetical protein